MQVNRNFAALITTFAALILMAGCAATLQTP